MMIEQVLPAVLAAAGGGVIGYIAGRINVSHWQSVAVSHAGTIDLLRRDIADGRQSYMRQMDAKDDAIRSLNARLHPLVLREERRLAQLRSISSKGGFALKAKRDAERKVAVAKTLAAMPGLVPKQTKSGAVVAAKAG